MRIASNRDKLWVYSMGKRFLVRAVTDTTEEANAYMEQHPETALIACFGPLNIIANKYEGERDPAGGREGVMCPCSVYVCQGDKCECVCHRCLPLRPDEEYDNDEFLIAAQGEEARDAK